MPKLLSEAEIAEIMAATRLDVEGASMALSKAGSARLGEVSPFVRTVLRTLKEKMPKPINMRGSVVVQFIVSVTVQVEMIRVAQSSGRPELDKLVVDGIRATKLVAPGKDTPDRDRMFQITYEYY